MCLVLNCRVFSFYLKEQIVPEFFSLNLHNPILFSFVFLLSLCFSTHQTAAPKHTFHVLFFSVLLFLNSCSILFSLLLFSFVHFFVLFFFGKKTAMLFVLCSNFVVCVVFFSIYCMSGSEGIGICIVFVLCSYSDGLICLIVCQDLSHQRSYIKLVK